MSLTQPFETYHRVDCTHLDLRHEVKSIKLVQELKHGTLNLTFATTVCIIPLCSDCIDLIDENNCRRILISNSEEFSHEFWTITEVLLNELTADYTQECCTCAIGDSFSKKRLACSRNTV